jgi:hypothetical protein
MDAFDILILNSPKEKTFCIFYLYSYMNICAFVGKLIDILQIHLKSNFLGKFNLLLSTETDVIRHCDDET